MRKIILAAVLAVATQIVNAQITQGNWMLGGNVSFSSLKENGVSGNATYFSLAPNVGYLIIDQFAAGVRGNIASYKDQSDDKYTAILIGPFARYYFLATGKKTNVFLDGTFMFGSEKYKPSSGTSTTDNKTAFGFMAGPAFFLSNNVALEIALAYNSNKYKSASGSDNTFGVNVGFQIHLNTGGTAKKK